MSRAPLRPPAAALVLALAACTTEAPPPAPRVEPPPVASAPAAPPSRAAQPLSVGDGAVRCAAMARTAAAGVRIVQAQFIAADVAYPVNWNTRRIAGKALPAHCRLAGSVVADARAAVAFELRLPSAWNGRFFMQGRSGDEGVVEAIGRNTGAGGFEDNALARGFAVLAADAGESAQSAVSPPRARLDQALAANLIAARSAKALIGTYYGKAPERSYFVGCGEGGRDGLVFAQRQPEVFDGVVAVAPLLREADAALAAAWTLQRFESVAPRTRARKRVLSRAFDSEQLFSVAEAVLQQCDALDGAADGFVQDMAGCRFDPAVLACKRGKAAAGCLKPPQLKALSEAMAGPRDAGAALYFAWPWDPGIAGPGWRAWNLGSAVPPAAPDARHLSQTAATLGAELMQPPEPKLELLKLRFDRDLPRLAAARQARGAADEVQLDGLRERQGRLLLVHGAADPVVSAWATVDYQRRVDARLGAEFSARFVRSFIVPGMNHCAGGPATDRFDALAAMVDWVEQEQPPQRIEARGSAVLHDETRPLCPWPQVARYRGSGPLHASASYACR